MAALQTHLFGWLDYVIFVAMFLAAIGIGLYHAFSKGGQSSTNKYFMANRSMGLVPTTLSILVSVVSANTLLGVPAEVYNYGIHIMLRSASSFLSVTGAAFIFVPVFYPLKLTSVHEYLELRFQSRLVRLLGTFLLIITQVLYVGCVIFGPAIALETATGVAPWASILLVAGIGTTYTAMGGMKAVIWTDVFQSGIMFVGMLTVIVLGTNHVGSFGRVWDINQEWGRLHVSFNPDPTQRLSFWVLMIGYATYWIGGFGVNQPCVQRYCAMKSLNMAKFSLLLNGPGHAIFNGISSIAGMVAFAYYTKQQCDPIKAGFVSNSNQLLPYFVMDVMNYPGLPGLYLACLFSGSLSTLSSSINSLSAVIWEDLLKNHFHHLPESKKTLCSKAICILFGFICMAMPFLVWAIGGNLIQMAASFFGASIGPLIGLFLLGATFPWANWIGALAGGLSATFLNLWILVGQTLYKTQRLRLPSTIEGCYLTGEGNITIETTPWSSSHSGLTTWEDSQVSTTETPDVISPGLRWFYSISFGWFPFGAVIITMVIGIVVSLLSGRTDPSTVESRLLVVWLRDKYGKETGSEEEKEPAFDTKGDTFEELNFHKVPCDSNGKETPLRQI